MSVYPNEINERAELDLRLGIKSSLANLNSLFALVYCLFRAYQTEVEFAEEYVKSNGKTAIRLKDDVLNTLIQKFELDAEHIEDAERENFKEKVNQNPLLDAQIEPLQVSLQLFWKLAKVEFVNTKYPNSKERTGSHRYCKRLSFSTNCDVIYAFEDYVDNDEFNTFLYKSILKEDVQNYNTQRNLISKLLTIFSEETIFKIRDTNDEILFQQEGIYEQIVNGNEVIAKDEKEDVGPFRILKSFVGGGLHHYLKKNGNNFSNRNSDKYSNYSFQNYLSRVSTFLDLSPKRTVIYVENEPEIVEFSKTPIQNLPHQKIYFGSPGTGKSYRINNEIAKGYEKFVVTFHPDFDYFDFVGSYKPETIEENGEKKIVYAFVAQRFMEAYIRAWQTDEPVFLIIEEINRGRCASIFGDVFQLLDRDENGFSEYFVSVSKELSEYLKSVLGLDKNYIERIEKLYFDKNNRDLENPFSILSLPNNLFIHATMNTSDQALFPMDSAFKRRWEWEYVPIDYEKSADFVIDFGALGRVEWKAFLENINQKIYDITQSEDKQIGTWFVKTNDLADGKKVISKAQFLNKVLYYLWFDVFMYESKSQESYIFKIQSNDEITAFSYSKLFGNEMNRILEGFLKFNNILLNEL
jgi:hypothetical protein